ncbi:MAG: hypothetical protein JWR45_2163 [Blastococcus sp.]|jgi:hypothetical protein|nr:hypothetical protein [Blastococcus sp.]
MTAALRGSASSLPAAGGRVDLTRSLSAHPHGASPVAPLG